MRQKAMEFRLNDTISLVAAFSLTEHRLGAVDPGTADL
jgi:hypothetical protein